MESENLANLIKTELQNGINALNGSGHLPLVWFEKHSVSSPRSILHSRIIGILARINLGEGWVLDIERALKPSLKGGYRFTPDIIAWTKETKMGVVIEFSSIDTSGHYIIKKNIEDNFLRYVSYPSGDGLPVLWVIISTLKDGPTNDYPSWDFTKGGIFYDNDDKLQLRKLLSESPLKFWKGRYEKAIEAAFKNTKRKCPICWMNINSGKVNIEFLKMAV